MSEREMPPQHDWWDPGERYPRLRMFSKVDGSIILSCKACGIIKGRNPSTKPCRGVVKIELRGEERDDFAGGAVG